MSQYFSFFFCFWKIENNLCLLFHQFSQEFLDLLFLPMNFKKSQWFSTIFHFTRQWIFNTYLPLIVYCPTLSLFLGINITCLFSYKFSILSQHCHLFSFLEISRKTIPIFESTIMRRIGARITLSAVHQAPTWDSHRLSILPGILHQGLSHKTQKKHTPPYMVLDCQPWGLKSAQKGKGRSYFTSSTRQIQRLPCCQNRNGTKEQGMLLEDLEPISGIIAKKRGPCIEADAVYPLPSSINPILFQPVGQNSMNLRMEEGHLTDHVGLTTIHIWNIFI